MRFIKIMLMVLAVCAATRALADSTTSQVNPFQNLQLQDQIDEILSELAMSGASIESSVVSDALSHLMELADVHGSSLVLELTYYTQNAETTELTMGCVALFNYMNFSVDDKLSAVLPHLGVRDTILHLALTNILSSIDRIKDGDIDFSAYEPFIDSAAMSDSEELIAYMFELSPEAALLSLLRINKEAIEEIEELRSVATSIGEAHTILDREGTDAFELRKPQALRFLENLSHHDIWWVRLYVAEVLRQVPALGTSELVDLLGKDDNKLVRRAAIVGVVVE